MFKNYVLIKFYFLVQKKNIFIKISFFENQVAQNYV